MPRSITPIPTTFMGCQFRSRLEARWAYFLNLCGCHWVYEPFGKGRTPDFGITIRKAYWYMEVKPSPIATEYMDHIRRQGIHLLAIGGFYQQQHPVVLLLEPDKLKQQDFLTFFNTSSSSGSAAITTVQNKFLAAERYRFDLR